MTTASHAVGPEFNSRFLYFLHFFNDVFLGFRFFSPPFHFSFSSSPQAYSLITMFLCKDSFFQVTIFTLLFLLGLSTAFTLPHQIFRATSTTTTQTTTSLESYLDGLSSFSTPQAASFVHVPVLSLGQADAIATNVVNICERNGFNPVTVNVLDASGSVLVAKRMDGCSPVGIPEISRAKAYSCIVNKYPSRAFRDRYTSEEASAKFCQMTSMVAISGNQMAPFPGGIVLKLGDYVIGAVGVSGAAGDEDEYCAIQAVLEADLGLSTVPEQHSCATVRD